MKHPTMEDQQSFCTFFLTDLYLGIEVLSVQEVIRYQSMTPVPLAPSAVRGLMNLRGQIVTAIDLRTRLGLPSPVGEATPMNVVVRTLDGPVSLLVDRIGDVMEINEAECEPPPDTLAPEIREIVDRVFKLEDRLLLTLNVDELLLPAATL